MRGFDPNLVDTTRTRLTAPLNGMLYVTTRKVALETPIPIVGDSVRWHLGKALVNSIIIAVTDGPDKDEGVFTITHAEIPDEPTQRLTNWEFNQCDLGGTKYDGIVRTVIMLASNYPGTEPNPGDAMPIASNNLFSGQGYIYVSRSIGNSGTQLEPIFRVVKYQYVKRVTFTDYEAQPETGISNPAKTTLYYTGEKVGTPPTPPATDSRPTINSLIADPANTFWKADTTGFANTLNEISSNWFSVTYRNIRNLNPEYKTVDDRLYPEQYMLDPTTSTETDSYSNPPSPIIVPTATLGESVTSHKKGVLQEISVTVQTGGRGPIKGTSLDERTGQALPTKSEIVPIGEVTESSVDERGVIVTYSPHDARLSERLTRQLMSGKVIDWVDMQPYLWPSVLLEATLKQWNTKWGDPVFFLRGRMKKEFRGIQAHHMRQWWQLENPNIVNPAQMIPDQMMYQSPVVTVEIPECLHDVTTFYTHISGSRTWADGDDSKTYPATNYLDWPDSMTWTESKSVLGGYLVTETTIYRPDYDSTLIL